MQRQNRAALVFLGRILGWLEVMFFWDPNPIAWTVPWLELPIAWYGVLFAGGLWGATQLGRRLLRQEALADGMERSAALRWSRQSMDQLAGWALIGCVLGARVVHCLAYDPGFYLTHPASILAIREGGLASHGGIAGIVLAILLLSMRRGVGPWVWFDLVGAVYAVPAVAIRLGNFINQEIMGVPTGGEWGVIFGHPVDRVSLVPRHPVQLYEALAYGCLGVVAYRFWKRGARLGTGQLAGLGLVGAFAIRFLLEWWKEEQAHWSPAGLTLGQWLSIPCILAGLWMLQRCRRQRNLAT